MVKRVMAQLLESGSIQRGYLGAQLAVIFEPHEALRLGLDRVHGALVERIFPGTPAAAADLRPSDVILQLNDNGHPQREPLHQPGERHAARPTRPHAGLAQSFAHHAGSRRRRLEQGPGPLQIHRQLTRLAATAHDWERKRTAPRSLRCSGKVKERVLDDLGQGSVLQSAVGRLHIEPLFHTHERQFPEPKTPFIDRQPRRFRPFLQFVLVAGNVEKALGRDAVREACEALLRIQTCSTPVLNGLPSS